MKKVSIVIPTYNRDNLLLNALNSIVKQTYSNLEVVIVDDFSTDNTQLYVSSFEGLDIVYYPLEKNLGYIKARNIGIQIATGDYISFLDSDDSILPHKIELLVNKAGEEKTDLVYAGWRWMNFETGKIRVERKPDEFGLIDSLPRWCYNVVPDLVDANIMKQLSFNIEASNNENLDFFIRMAQLKKSSFVCEVLSEYRDHQGARESSNLLGMIAGLEFIVSQHLDFIKNQKYWLSEKYLSLAIMIKKTNGDINKRNHYFLKSVIHRPFYLRNWAHWLFSFFR